MLVIQNCVFKQNAVGDKGGAIYISYQIGMIASNNFIGNSAGSGGALYYEESCIYFYYIILYEFNFF